MGERLEAFRGGFWSTVGVLAALLLVGFILRRGR